MKKQEQINRLQFRIERIESHLAEQHKGNNFNLSEKPNSCEPNPYAVDWSNAPEWAEFHMYDETKSGYFKGWVTRGCFWNGCFAPSGFTLPTGLDWKLSKTTRPK